MYSTIASAALLGFSAIAAARPAMPAAYSSAQSSSTSSAAMSYSTGLSSSGQKAFDFPLSNGFPNITKGSQAQKDIETQAHGQIPNQPPPPPPHADSLVSLGFVAFNELFEVAFFTELIYNITNNLPGYDNVPSRDNVLEILKIHQAQEELHELNANFAFNAFTNETILPCEYIFPVDNFNDAIAFAAQFTDVVLSTLPDIQTIFAQSQDNGLIRGVGAVIGQEGEQDGFYRTLIGKPPAQLPFLTQGARDFALSAIVQNAVVDGSCPSLSLLTIPDQLPATKGAHALKVFDVLTPVTDAKDFTIEKDIVATFKAVTAQSVHSTTPKAQSFAVQQTSGLFVTYLNQANVPVVVAPTSINIDSDGALIIEASFPGKTNFLNGLTIVAVTNANVTSSPDAVADATLFGPALIEIN